ncbi:hypothetical protein [Acinetobacter towneri]|uniref:hypothetical protein n=1 Tax=Acinetobacter TaxID=469 RepID=UPI002574B5D2|nr:hypothetical protein [Acinetobacter towneri]MEB6563969.1 hypothetical protein [Acinetobacter towneri]
MNHVDAPEKYMYINDVAVPLFEWKVWLGLQFKSLDHCLKVIFETCTKNSESFYAKKIIKNEFYMNKKDI